MASNFPPKGYKRFNANIPIDMHTKLKMASVLVSKPMGDLIQQLIRDELDTILRKGINA